MNELEIAAWSLWVDELNWAGGDLSMDDFLFVTAIQSKSYMNPESEMSIYMKKIGTDYPPIKSMYESWQRNESRRVRLQIIDINKRYKKFRQVSHVFFSRFRDSTTIKTIIAISSEFFSWTC